MKTSVLDPSAPIFVPYSGQGHIIVGSSWQLNVQPRPLAKPATFIDINYDDFVHTLAASDVAAGGPTCTYIPSVALSGFDRDDDDYPRRPSPFDMTAEDSGIAEDPLGLFSHGDADLCINAIADAAPLAHDILVAAPCCRERVATLMGNVTILVS